MPKETEDSSEQTRHGPADDTQPVDRQRLFAESSNYRSGPLPDSVARSRRKNTDIYNSTAKSMRLHPRTARASLAMKIATPIIAGMLIGVLGFSFIIEKRVTGLQLTDLKNDTANVVFSTAALGRLLIVHREKFMAENPQYGETAEWKTGDHWLHAYGFVKTRDWIDATGFNLDEYAPVPVLEKAGQSAILADLGRWMNTPGAGSEIVAAYILAEDDSVIASASDAGFRFSLQTLKSIPPPGAYRDAGGAKIWVDYISDFKPEPVVRGIARIMSPDEPDRPIGAAVIVMRTQHHLRQRSELIYLLAALAIALTALMSIICWLSARRITKSIRGMAADMQAIAEGDFDRRAPAAEQDELGLLAQAFNSMAERLRVARANEQETSRLESDLAIARSIQNNLLPPQTPHVRGLDIHTSYRPAREIGGDYYDFLPVDNRHMGLVVADASGKSIPAALVMSTTRAILRFVAPGNNSAAETLTRVNAILSVDIPKGMFVTAYYIILDPLANTMLCASAGHTPLLIARADGSVELMNPGGIALGFDGGPIFQRSIREQRVKLETGDRGLLYTDGVAECVNAANEEYSERRLREFLRRNRELSSSDFVGALLADLDRHRGPAEMRDDTTIVTFRVL